MISFPCKVFLLLLFSGLVCRCATLEVATTPTGAQISIIGADGQARQIGTTPLAVRLSELRNENDGDSLLVLIAQDNYQPQQIAVPLFSSGRLRLQVGLNPIAESNQESSRNLGNAPFRILLKAYRALMQNDLNRSNGLVEELERLVPEYAAPKLLRGLIALRQGNMEAAANLFRQARQLDPDDPDIANLLKLTQ